MKTVRVRSYSSPHFSAFGLNTERYGVSFSIQSERGKIRTGITPNTDTFHAVYSKFQNILYPTSTKILVHWLVKRRHMIAKYIPCSTLKPNRVVLLIKKSVQWFGWDKILKWFAIPCILHILPLPNHVTKSICFCESYVQEILFSFWESKMFRGNSCMLFP